MSLHVIFIDKDGQQLSDVTSNFTGVQIPQDAFIMRICDDTKSYSNSTLTKLFEIDNTFYSKILEYTTKGDYSYIDINVQDFGGFTAIFNQLSAQFVGNNPPVNIYDFSGYGGGSSGGDIDFSTIVTALNSIATALSALTNLNNLSNLTQLANIITTIQNKDNQSHIVNKLNDCFSYKLSDESVSRSVFSGTRFGASIGGTSSSGRLCYSVVGLLNQIRQCFINDNYDVVQNPTLSDKFLANLYTLNTTSSSNVSDYRSNSYLNRISEKLQNIETKLEQNLPFTTLAQVDVVTDYTQVVKGVGKNE